MKEVEQAVLRDLLVDRGGDDPTRRSRTASRDRREDPNEDTVASLHKRLALMFMTVVEGNYTPRERVTPYGNNQTLKHLLGAAKSLDDGFYFVVKDALDYLGGPEEYKAVKLLSDMLDSVERAHGPLPTDLSKLLFQRYKEVLQDAGYPVLRLEEMVYGPDDNWESESSYTIQPTFRADASRSHDSSPERETESERLRRYQQSTMGEVSSPEFWQAVHHFESSSIQKNGQVEKLYVAKKVKKLDVEKVVKVNPQLKLHQKEKICQNMVKEDSTCLSQRVSLVDMDEEYAIRKPTRIWLRRRSVEFSTPAMVLT